jgi:hypothetical protein
LKPPFDAVLLRVTEFLKNQKPSWASPSFVNRSEPKKITSHEVVPVGTGHVAAFGVSEYFAANACRIVSLSGIVSLGFHSQLFSGSWGSFEPPPVKMIGS